MNVTDQIDSEARLARALHARAGAEVDSPPPVFSWQSGSVALAHEHQRSRPRRRFARGRLAPRIAAVAVPVAVAAAVVVATMSGSGTAPGSGTGPAAGGASAVAYLRPGSNVPMVAGQFFYRKDVSVTVAGELVVELWQPQTISDTWTVKTYRQNADGSIMGKANVQTGACGQFLPVAPGATPTCNPAGTWATPTPTFLTSLPTDPAALYQQLSAYVLADYKTTASDRTLDFSTGNIAFLTINYIRSIATSAGGMSEPFSKALQGAIALIPGVIVKHDVKNLVGASGTSYEVDASPTNVAGPLIFDPNGNFIGSPTSAVSLGVAASAGGTPTIS